MYVCRAFAVGSDAPKGGGAQMPSQYVEPVLASLLERISDSNARVRDCAKRGIQVLAG